MPRPDQDMAANGGLIIDFPKQRLVFRVVAPLFAAKENKDNPCAFVRYVPKLIANVEAADRLAALRGVREPVPDILAAAEAIVTAYEPYLEGHEDPRASLLNWFRRRKEEGLHSRRAYEAFSILPRTSRATLVESASRSAVYPAVALKVMRKAASDDIAFRELADLAAQDQALAGHLMAAANCSLNPTVSRIATIRHAMTYIGLQQTRTILTAAAMRPLFATRALSQLWRHSLTVAAWCESLARSTGFADPAEAFVCGLVHDIGRLIMLTASGEAPVTLERFKARGCDLSFVEMLLFGCNHGFLGSEILSRWHFPERLIEGVAGHDHFRQNGSFFSALLYLAEAACADEEPKPSPAEQREAMERLGIAEDSLQANGANLGPLAVLAFAA